MKSLEKGEIKKNSFWQILLYMDFPPENPKNNPRSIKKKYCLHQIIPISLQPYVVTIRLFVLTEPKVRNI